MMNGCHSTAHLNSSRFAEMCWKDAEHFISYIGFISGPGTVNLHADMPDYLAEVVEYTFMNDTKNYLMSLDRAGVLRLLMELPGNKWDVRGGRDVITFEGGFIEILPDEHIIHSDYALTVRIRHRTHVTPCGNRFPETVPRSVARTLSQRRASKRN